MAAAAAAAQVRKEAAEVSVLVQAAQALPAIIPERVVAELVQVPIPFGVKMEHPQQQIPEVVGVVPVGQPTQVVTVVAVIY